MSPSTAERIRAAAAAFADEIVAALADEAAPAPDRLLSIDEAAAILGLGRTVVYGELQAGRLRSLKVGRRRLVPAAAIADYIAEAGR